jgi:hypothetical protein
VQLATDPDPPSDEVGTTGTHMFHAADGDRRFNRALVWQPLDPSVQILREPREALPKVGVDCLEAAIVVTDGEADAGYVPLQVMQSTGAVQTSGVQQQLQVTGLIDLLNLSRQELASHGASARMYLRPKGERWPFLNGNNHLVWQDGEPIDPFVFAVLSEQQSDESAFPTLLFQREVFNEGLSLLEMSPLQRLLSARGPCGFDADLSHVPAWAMPADTRQRLLDPQFASIYLRDRALVLKKVLASEIGRCNLSRDSIDSIISLAERMRLVSVPRGTTVAWLQILLHYGHTISGDIAPAPPTNPVLAAVAAQSNLQLSVTQPSGRNSSNSRWLVRYTNGVMDTDALSHFIFGELLIPLDLAATSSDIELSRTWSFAGGLKAVVADYGCRFNRPFWADYTIDGNTRTTTLPDGTRITEVLDASADDLYTYSASGFPGISAFAGEFRIVDDDDRVRLIWKYKFSGNPPEAVVTFLALTARTRPGHERTASAALWARGVTREIRRRSEPLRAGPPPPTCQPNSRRRHTATGR